MGRTEMMMRARSLRKRQTEAERILWEFLRDRRFHGMKFHRQHPVYFNMYRSEHYYIADFYCAEHMLVIELDGSSHFLKKQYDEIRDFEMSQYKGFRTLRILNHEVYDLEKLGEKILKFISNHPTDRHKVFESLVLYSPPTPLSTR